MIASHITLCQIVDDEREINCPVPLDISANNGVRVLVVEGILREHLDRSMILVPLDVEEIVVSG